MSPRVRIAEYGVRRSGARALVFTDIAGADRRTVVEWREGGRKVQKAWPDTGAGRREARQYAQGVVERLSSGRTGRPRLTLAELFARYVLAHEDAWRPKSRVNELRRWRYFVETVGPHTFADLVTPDTLDEVRRTLRTHRSRRAPGGIVPSQVAGILANVKRVFRFAAARKHLAANPLADYAIRSSKDERALDVAEFPPAEAAAVIARFTPRDSRRWRAWVACTIAATQGTRVTAILRAEEADYDLAARTVRWRSAHDKLGRERVQPLTKDAVHAVRVARIWRRRLGYAGRYLIPAGRQARRDRDEPWSYAALHRLVVVAEREAGVPHRPFRAMHGFRRTAAGSVLELTGGNIKAVGDWIGDTDLRVLQRSYLKQRPEHLTDIAAKLRTPTEATARPATTRRITPTEES